MAYASSITLYIRRNHTIRVVVDLTSIPSITGAILCLTIRKGTISGTGIVAIIKTNSTGDGTQAAVVGTDTVEFYLKPVDTANLAPGDYAADATIQTSLGLFQLLPLTAVTMLRPITT
jgi:hypothetical protein